MFQILHIGYIEITSSLGCKEALSYINNVFKILSQVCWILECVRRINQECIKS